ncbi:unnamed protein product [Rotaria magnacalcarata]|uniref:Uncharacterized protein n=1 Tax=Rotaria magnacalcarata TaxID=392030 RepID=A0A816M643_9BILA|nr:unnamed protein product [Rotaria magnacalcarata]
MSSSSSTSSSNESATSSLSSSSTVRQRSNTNVLTERELIALVEENARIRYKYGPFYFKRQLENQLRKVKFNLNTTDITKAVEPDDETSVGSNATTSVERHHASHYIYSKSMVNKLGG